MADSLRALTLGHQTVPGAGTTGAALAEIGLAIPPQRTLTAVVLLIEAENRTLRERGMGSGPVRAPCP